MFKTICLALLLTSVFCATSQVAADCQKWQTVWEAFTVNYPDWFKASEDTKNENKIKNYYDEFVKQTCADGSYITVTDDQKTKWKLLPISGTGAYTKIYAKTTVKAKVDDVDKDINPYDDVFVPMVNSFAKEVATTRRNTYNLILANIQTIAKKQCKPANEGKDVKSFIDWAKKHDTKVGDKQALTALKDLWKNTALAAQVQLDIFRTLLSYAFVMDGDTDKFTFDADKKLTDFKVTDDANWKKLVTAAKALKAQKTNVDKTIKAYFAKYKGSDSKCDADEDGTTYKKLIAITKSFSDAVCNDDDCTQWNKWTFSKNFANKLGYADADMTEVTNQSGLTTADANKNQIEVAARRNLAATTSFSITKDADKGVKVIYDSGNEVKYVGFDQTGTCKQDSVCKAEEAPTTSSTETTEATPTSDSSSATILQITALIAMVFFL